MYFCETEKTFLKTKLISKALCKISLYSTTDQQAYGSLRGICRLLEDVAKRQTSFRFNLKSDLPNDINNLFTNQTKIEGCLLSGRESLNFIFQHKRYLIKIISFYRPLYSSQDGY